MGVRGESDSTIECRGARQNVNEFPNGYIPKASSLSHKCVRTCHRQVTAVPLLRPLSSSLSLPVLHFLSFPLFLSWSLSLLPFKNYYSRLGFDRSRGDLLHLFGGLLYYRALYYSCQCTRRLLFDIRW